MDVTDDAQVQKHKQARYEGDGGTRVRQSDDACVKNGERQTKVSFDVLGEGAASQRMPPDRRKQQPVQGDARKKKGALLSAPLADEPIDISDAVDISDSSAIDERPRALRDLLPPTPPRRSKTLAGASRWTSVAMEVEL